MRRAEFGLTWNMTCTAIGGLWRVAAMPLKMLDISDILLDYAHPHLAIFHTAQACSLDPATMESLSLEQLVREATAGGRAVNACTAVIPSSQLVPLLEDCDFYDLRLFDLERFDEETVIEGVLFVEGQHFEQIVLPHLRSSQLYFDSHDDCYIYLETAHRCCARRIAVRAFQTYAGTQLLRELGAPQEIADMPEAVLDALWPEGAGSITIPPAATLWEAGALSIGVSFTKHSFQPDQPYPIDAVVTYTPAEGCWAVRRTLSTEYL